MRKIVLFLFLVSANFYHGYSQELPESENDTIIVWTEDRKLTWDDFQKKNFKGARAAQSDIGIDVRTVYQGNSNYKYIVIAYFYKRESSTETDNLNVLKHEQVHFDIAELFARKMRNRLNLLSREKFNKQKYHLTIDEVYENYFLFQGSYDKETKHSIEKERQKEWNIRIASELKELRGFRSKVYASSK